VHTSEFWVLFGQGDGIGEKVRGYEPSYSESLGTQYPVFMPAQVAAVLPMDSTGAAV
jgi:hypothetical protein